MFMANDKVKGRTLMLRTKNLSMRNDMKWCIYYRHDSRWIVEPLPLEDAEIHIVTVEKLEGLISAPSECKNSFCCYGFYPIDFNPEITWPDLAPGRPPSALMDRDMPTNTRWIRLQFSIYNISSPCL
ncbi:hypothetical protein SLE2022_385760 [Rubroshorea leprosula]